ncbi:hypothetical protein BH11PSE3_BH11PSE3_39550 [soil metagenome]
MVVQPWSGQPLRMACAATLLAGLLASLLTACPAMAQEGPSSQYRGLTTIDIPFANGPIAMSHVPTVWLKLSGSAPHRFGMDTGSTGIVVAAEHYTPGPNDVADGPGHLTYNSSGRVLQGDRYTTDVVIQRDEYTPAATARVQVLRVTRITCLERARDCRPENNPRGVAFMGVGFARNAAQGTESGASKNPFTSLVSLASGAPVSSVRPGYIVTRSGVHLGMTAELTRNFAFIKLAPSAGSHPGAPEWSATPMAVSVNGATGNGTILVDTGINYMFLSPPEGAGLERGRRVPEGSRITLFMPDQRNPQPAFYGFTVGERGNPMHPERVETVQDRGVFVNTGRMFLEGFDYLYDALGGYVGFGWNGRLSGGYGGATPGLSYAR